MKHIKLYEEFVNEVYRVPVKYGEDTFNSHKNHNPNVDIVERQINKDTKVTYGIYVKDSGSKKKGDEFMEIYTGKNYVVGSTAKSYSRYFDADKIPAAYRKTWEELKSKYETELKESITEAAEPKFVVHKGAAVMGYASSKIQEGRMLRHREQNTARSRTIRSSTATSSSPRPQSPTFPNLSGRRATRGQRTVHGCVPSGRVSITVQSASCTPMETSTMWKTWKRSTRASMTA